MSFQKDFKSKIILKVKFFSQSQIGVWLLTEHFGDDSYAIVYR